MTSKLYRTNNNVIYEYRGLFIFLAIVVICKQ